MYVYSSAMHNPYSYLQIDTLSKQLCHIIININITVNRIIIIAMIELS